MVCYAVKANGNLAVLRALASLGAGADIVSGGELYRVMRAGFDPKKVVFAGVGKTDDELLAGLGERILLFNVESASELEHLERLAARHGKTRPSRWPRGWGSTGACNSSGFISTSAARSPSSAPTPNPSKRAPDWSRS
jgi:diaminopimelate decarboxylase